MENEIVESATSPVLVYPDVADSPWFEFIQGMTNSLAWPLVVVLAIILFHRQILDKLPEIDGLKVPGAEMTFKNRVKAVVEQAKEIDNPDDGVAQENNVRLAALVDMAAASPTGAIIAAWKDLEAASVELVSMVSKMIDIETFMSSDGRSGGIRFENMMRSRSKIGLSRFMLRLGLLPMTEAKTFEELRKLRNRATHEPEGTISVEEARSYVRVADKLTDLIRTNIRNIETAPVPGPAED